eukprot:UN12692
MAFDHLTKMGFKSQMAQKALKQNKINLSRTIQTLIAESVQELEQNDKFKTIQSPFIPKSNCPSIKKMNSAMFVSANPQIMQLSPTQSSTEEVDDDFVLKIM